MGNLVRKLDDVARSRGESTTPEDLNEVSETTTKIENESLLNNSSAKKVLLEIIL